MAKFGQMIDDDGLGVKGYRMPKHSVQLKPQASMISKAKPYGGMLDSVIKLKRTIPGPSAYKTEMSMLLFRHNPIVNKSPRHCEGALVEIREKKHKRPGVGAHHIRFVEPRVIGGKSDKSDRIGYLDEVMFKAKTTPGYN